MHVTAPCWHKHTYPLPLMCTTLEEDLFQTGMFCYFVCGVSNIQVIPPPSPPTPVPVNPKHISKAAYLQLLVQESNITLGCDRVSLLLLHQRARNLGNRSDSCTPEVGMTFRCPAGQHGYLCDRSVPGIVLPYEMCCEHPTHV